MNSELPIILFVFLFIMAVFSLIGIFFPHLAWRMSEGWKFKEPVEPSALWILGSRISGVIALGVVLFLADRICNSERARYPRPEFMRQFHGPASTRPHGNPIPNRVDAPAP